MSYAGTIVVLGITRGLFGIPISPVATLVSAASFGIRIFGSLYGIVLWTRTNASRLSAGLFAVTLPAVFVLSPLVLVGVPAVGIEAPLYLAFIALGVDLLTADVEPAAENTTTNG
ncbi:hypothetical protein [Halosolutus gelatinilyticus]|uniref:hypothetical protein n=1 Tax=Halosolutus gelatinilyticus TaxID=2931975 RepID=UPI001FF4F3B8|nr:hypothetical protein [Halosolutus gelatinilyticus]